LRCYGVISIDHGTNLDRTDLIDRRYMAPTNQAHPNNRQP
jgi:hypothetical protein